jgi:3-dehydroquinate dehydratase I
VAFSFSGYGACRGIDPESARFGQNRAMNALPPDIPGSFRRIVLRGRPLGSGNAAAICIPLVESTESGLMSEADAAVKLHPDAIEWRADGFANSGQTSDFVAVAHKLRAALGEIPLVFTLRAASEGGNNRSMDFLAAQEIYSAICAAGAADAIDTELSRGPKFIRAIRRSAEEAKVALILSTHDFAATPSIGAMCGMLAAMEQAGADVAKIAVMPNSAGDVESLLQATRRAREALSIPVVTMSMGAMGLQSRVRGAEFGSALTFAAGQNASAPGQISIEALREAMQTETQSGVKEKQR